MSKLHNFAYTIPTIGRIAMGERIEKNGKSLPQKLNHFLITKPYKSEGRWVNDPVIKTVADSQGVKVDEVREIPIKFAFNNVDLNLRERYEAFDNMGRMLCAGDGKDARRMVQGKTEELACPGPDYCDFARTARCSLMTRLNVQIDLPETQGDEQGASDAEQHDPMSTYILRSAGFNSARTLRSKLTGLAAMFGGRLTGVPFSLVMRKKTSAMSRQSAFYYADLVLRVPPAQAARQAKEHAEACAQAGLDQDAFEAVMLANLANGPFEDTMEEAEEVADYVAFDEGPAPANGEQTGQRPSKPAVSAPVGKEAADGLARLREFLNAEQAAEETEAA